MTKRQLLETYREAVQQLDELDLQLQRVGTDGRPAGYRTASMDVRRGTNAPSAAAMQLADGLTALAARKRDELAQLAVPVHAIINEIGDFRTFAVVQRYYLMAETDAAISAALCISRPRVNQIRLKYLAGLD